MKLISFALAFALLVPLSLMSGPVSAGASDQGADYTEFQDPFEQPETAGIADPLEPINRTAFWINDYLYTRVLSPIIRATPQDWIPFLTEAWRRVSGPPAVGEVELQFRARDGGSELGRFVLHALIGILGKVEPEKTVSLADGSEDFDRTLEAFGMEPGFYLVLPVLGPSTLRDGIGRLADFYLDPSPEMFGVDGKREEPAVEESLVGNLQTYLAVRRDSLDPYLFIRDAYSQQQTAATVLSRTDQGGVLWNHRLALLL